VSRSDSIVGLSQGARKFLDDNQVIPEPCPTCNRPFRPKSKICGIFRGMFDDEYPLYEYELKDGRTAKEVVQADPWASGPCFFLKLVVDDETEFCWTEEEIEEKL